MDFFIVGTSRSGTTLLRHMLDAHSGVTVLNESHWVPRMSERFGAAEAPLEDLISLVERTRWDSGRRVLDVNLELAGVDRDSLTTALRRRLGSGTTIAAFHQTLIQELFGARPGVVWGDKTPDYGFYMVMLQGLWPQARFVHVVRNGIDTSLSMAEHPGCQLMISAGYDNWVPLCLGEFRRHERYDLPFSRYVGSWRRRMERIRGEAEDLHPGSYLEVRYEDLTTNTRQVLAAVASHLDVAPVERWTARCSRLVRRRAPRSLTRDMLSGVTAEDREMLQQVGGLREEVLGLLDATTP